MIIETGQIWRMKRVNSKEVFIDNIIQPHGDKEPSIYYRKLGETEPHQNEWLFLRTFLILFELKDQSYHDDYIYKISDEQYVMTTGGLRLFNRQGHTSYEIRDI